jgi:hypothetical protein
MEASFERWSKRLVEKLGEENVLQTVECLHELREVLDADTDYLGAPPAANGPT